MLRTNTRHKVLFSTKNKGKVKGDKSKENSLCLSQKILNEVVRCCYAFGYALADVTDKLGRNDK